MPRKSSSLLKRRLKIAELVDQQGEIKVEDLSALLGVSGVTIRGDLSYLEQQGYLKRSFGGAIATNSYLNGSTQPESGPQLHPLTLAHKLEIAHHCARLIADRQTVFLGYGEISRKIIPFLSGKKKLRLIVNDLHHALLAEQYIDGDIIVAGEELIRSQLLLSGKAFDDTIQKSTINHCIFEAAIHDTTGGLILSQPLLTNHYQRCLDKAQNSTAIISFYPELSGPITTFTHLEDFNNLVASRFIHEHYQQLLGDSDFSIHYSNNECFTWSNRN